MNNKSKTIPNTSDKYNPNITANANNLSKYKIPLNNYKIKNIVYKI
jgi:hypothetical protein